jgi:hypothetical protein
MKGPSPEKVSISSCSDRSPVEGVVILWAKLVSEMASSLKQGETRVRVHVYKTNVKPLIGFVTSTSTLDESDAPMRLSHEATS